MYKKLKNEINQHGFFYFGKLKIMEQFYKRKFKKLSVDYSECAITSETLNKKSLNPDSNINQASPYYELKKAFAYTGLNYADTCLLDIGCGFGRALNFGMMLNFKEVTGIDLNEFTVEKARANCHQMQKNGYTTNFNLFQKDASKYEIPKGTNLIYLFNPFGLKTMEDVVENILNYNKDKDRELYIVYAVPVFQQVFTAYKQCIKIYERLDGSKTKSEMVIFKIV